MREDLECIRELRSFVTIARYGNVGRAALELNKSQGTISHQLSRLEKQLGTALFLRHGRGVTLTPEGCSFLNHVEQALSLLATPIGGRRREASGPDSTVTVLGIPEELSCLLTNSLLGRIRQAFPSASVSIIGTEQYGFVDQVLAETMDIAVVQDISEMEELVDLPALCDPIGLVMSPRSSLANSRQPCRLRDVAQLPSLISKGEGWVHKSILKATTRFGLQFKASYVVGGLTSLKAMVRDDAGSALLPVSAVREELEAGTLLFSPIVLPTIAPRHSVVFRRDATEQVIEIASFLQKRLQELSPRKPLG